MPMTVGAFLQEKPDENGEGDDGGGGPCRR